MHMNWCKIRTETWILKALVVRMTLIFQNVCVTRTIALHQIREMVLKTTPIMGSIITNAARQLAVLIARFAVPPPVPRILAEGSDP
jgi:hypothetical protein